MSESKKESLYGKTLPQLQELCAKESLPRFAAGQIARWLYVNRVDDIEQMTNISVAARKLLKEKYTLGLDAPLKESVSQDGTKKYLYELADGNLIEGVFMKNNYGNTLCALSLYRRAG